MRWMWFQIHPTRPGWKFLTAIRPFSSKNKSSCTHAIFIILVCLLSSSSHTDAKSCRTLAKTLPLDPKHTNLANKSKPQTYKSCQHVPAWSCPNLSMETNCHKLGPARPLLWGQNIFSQICASWTQGPVFMDPTAARNYAHLTLDLLSLG